MLDERITFLNHGSYGALPQKVFDEQTSWRRRIEAEPIELLGRRVQELIDTAKAPVGQMLGMPTENFGFVTNATEAVNAVLKSLELKTGDELLTTNHVYNAVRLTMQHIVTRWGATYREFEVPLPIQSGDQIAAIVLANVTSQTRLLVIDHVTSPTALIFPVEEIVAGCRERGVDVLVDGAHAPGMLPLNVSKIGAAYYAGNLHKWVCGPKGSGFLYVRPDRQKPVHPLVISHEIDQGFAREFGWQGTRDISGWLSVPSSIAFMSELGWPRVMAHNHQLSTYVQRMLCDRWKVQAISPLDGSMIGSMCTVPLPGSLGELSRAAGLRLQQSLYSDHQIEVPVVPWDGRTFLRPCCQIYNHAGEYERLADVIAGLVDA